jgi:hypothetical protein
LICQIVRLRGRLSIRLALKQIVAAEGEDLINRRWERVGATVEVFL